MKKIFLLRHGKSDWSNPALEDYDRPLASRGIKSSKKIGKFFRKQEIFPELIICSTATRAKETLNLCLKKMKTDIQVKYDSRIYEYDAVNIINKVISEIHDDIKSVMLIGHYPDFEHIVEYITGENFPYPKFPTASLAVLECDITNWKDIAQSKGKLILFQTPKDKN